MSTMQSESHTSGLSTQQTIAIYRVHRPTMSPRAEARSRMDDLSRLCGRMMFSPMPQAFWTPQPAHCAASALRGPELKAGQVSLAAWVSVRAVPEEASETPVWVRAVPGEALEAPVLVQAVSEEAPVWVRAVSEEASEVPHPTMQPAPCVWRRASACPSFRLSPLPTG